MTRCFWLPGLNAVAGRQTGGLGGWLVGRDYQFHCPVGDGTFDLYVANTAPFLASVAADCSRLVCAAMESVRELRHAAHSPKASAWLLIRLYYASYFAAHGILRMFGTSVSQVDEHQTAAAEEVAELWSMLGAGAIGAGTYVCQFGHARHVLECRRPRTGSGGAHEALWATVRSRVQDIETGLLLNGLADSVTQGVADKLTEFRHNLCLQGCNGGNWLSMVRNGINYRQEYGCWFPYHDAELRSDLLRWCDHWKDDPMTLPLQASRERPLRCFVVTAAFLIAWCRAMANDMSQRCAQGRSFLATGPQAYLAMVGKH